MERQLIWQLVRAADETAECYVQPTLSGGLGITIYGGSSTIFTALATDLKTAQQLIAERKSALLRDGWNAVYEHPAW